MSSRVIGATKLNTTAQSGLYSINEVYLARLQGKWKNQLPPDPYAGNVVFYADFQTDSLLDLTGKAFSLRNSPTISGGTLNLNGTNQDMYVTNAELAMSTSDFCVEVLIEHNVSTVSQTNIMDNRASTEGWAWYFTSNTQLTLVGDPGAFGSMDPLTPGELRHYAFSRSGSTVRMFIGGALIHTTSSNVNCSGTTWYFGSNGIFNGYYLNGKFHAIRITKGVPRYTANFTPPGLGEI